MRHFGSLSRNLFAQTKKVSQKILCSVEKNSDSTPEYDKIHSDTTKLLTSRKSFSKKRVTMLKKRAVQNKTQKEKRLAAYNKFRRMSKVDRGSDATYSIGSSVNNISGVTYDLDASETTYGSDILHFQAEVNECQGPVEIFVENVDDEVDFEKLCNVKQSECPFVSKKIATYQSLSTPAEEKSSVKSVDDGEDLSPKSVNSNYSSNSTTRMSSHCARICWNQQKIPKLTTYRAEKKSFENDSQNSTRSCHNTQSLITTIRSVHSSVMVGWNDLPSYIRYYIISITILFIALLRYRLT